MSTILATYNICTQEWTIEKNSLVGYYIDLQIGFIDIQTPVVFNNVSMGFNFSQNSKDIISFQYPPEGTVIHSSDQPYIISYRIETEYSTTYNLKIWAENAGVYSETLYQFESIAAPNFDEMELATIGYEVE